MALETKASSRWWYARFVVNGKLRRFPLMEKRGGKIERIEVKGTRPRSMKHPEKWDGAFMESYHRAKAAHDRLLEEELSSKHIEDLAQRIIEAKTGTRLDFVKVEAIPEAWATLPRKRPLCEQYCETAKGTLRRFSGFMHKHFPGADDLAAVRADHIRAFLASEDERGISPRTWNVTLKLLKTVFRRLEPNSDAYRAFLKDGSFRDEKTVHREPFKEDDIKAIVESAHADGVLYGPIVTALCTAMRRGDCACLKWASVDLGAGFIEVRTSKTGETAEIPILPMLREVLNRAPKKGSDYVFPEAAELYQQDPHTLDRRLRLILARAGFVDTEIAERVTREKAEKTKPKPALPVLPPDEVRRLGLGAIVSGDMIEAKRERMKATFAAYLDGKGLPTIAREMGLSKSTVSLHLNEIEDKIGVAVLRRQPPAPVPAVLRGPLTAENGTGQRLKRGSIRGWHSFRVAFVTRALAGGMPEELVRRVTGHTAVDVVRRHYFKPGREEFRREFEKAMPQMLMNGAKSRDERLHEIIKSMTAKTLRHDKARALAILAGKTGAAP
jgi:integrase